MPRQNVGFVILDFCIFYDIIFILTLFDLYSSYPLTINHHFSLHLHFIFYLYFKTVSTSTICSSRAAMDYFPFLVSLYLDSRLVGRV
jgi:hypothetical protein